MSDDGPVAGSPVVGFSNIANVDGITGATICKLRVTIILASIPTTTTLNGTLMQLQQQLF